jgi:hypothetical protein
VRHTKNWHVQQQQQLLYLVSPSMSPAHHMRSCGCG